MAKDSAALIELGRSVHQVGTVNDKVILCLFGMAQ